MESYAQNAKYNLINARDELSSILSILNDSIVINNIPLSKGDVEKMRSDINFQINNLNNYIIPEIREKGND